MLTILISTWVLSYWFIVFSCLFEYCIYLRGWIYGKLEFGFLSVIHWESFHQQGRKPTSGSTSKTVEDQETLKPSALISLKQNRSFSLVKINQIRHTCMASRLNHAQRNTSLICLFAFDVTFNHGKIRFRQFFFLEYFDFVLKLIINGNAYQFSYFV